MSIFPTRNVIASNAETSLLNYFFQTDYIKYVNIFIQMHSTTEPQQHHVCLFQIMFLFILIPALVTADETTTSSHLPGKLLPSSVSVYGLSDVS